MRVAFVHYNLDAYLRHIFEKLPTAYILEHYEALLPWNIEADELAGSKALLRA